MIRRAEAKDLPDMVEMGARFFNASGYSDITEFDAESFKNTLVNAPAAVWLVAEKEGSLVGMAGAIVYPFYFNAHHKTSQELLWWVDPEHRGVGGELFSALESEVKTLGAQSLSMIALDLSEPEKVCAFYAKKGFRPSERSFIKRL